jgi:predicted permease
MGGAMQTFWQDVQYGMRMLLKNPGFTAIAILTLALGIGANTALFTVVNGVLLNPLPYEDPGSLVALYAKSKEFPRSSISYPNFLDWQRENHAFTALAAFRADDLNLTGVGEPERLRTEMVSAAFFPILGVKPVAGRGFSEQEDLLGGTPVALVAEGLWRRKFGASKDLIGKPINLNDRPYTVVGVIPGNFRYHNGNFHRNAEVFVPIGQWEEKLFRDRRAAMGMMGVGRLKPGVSFAQANAEMNALAAHLAERYPDINKESGVKLVPLKQSVVGEIRPFLLVLLAAVGFVLLIACANVANLLLAQSTGRTREFAIRTALGASRGRNIRQVLTESIILSLAGGVSGALVAAWGTQAAIQLLPDALPRAEEIALSGRVLFFTLGISVLAGVMFGLIPAFKTSGVDIHESLKEGGRGGSGVRHRTQGTLVAVEMALAVVLLAGAGLMIRSLANLWKVDPGFDPNHVLSFNLTSAQPLGETPTAARNAFLKLHDAIAAVPGVEAVSLTVGASPMAGDSELPLWLEGEPKPASQSEMKISLFYVTEPDYLKVMKIPLKRGRFLTDLDREKARPVTVIDEEFARRFMGATNPIGKRVNFDILNSSPEIVGVVGHVKQWGLDESNDSPVQAQCYFPMMQVPDSLMPLLAHGVQAVARTDPRLLNDMSAIHRAVGTVNSQMVVYGTQPMTEVIAGSLAAKRFAMMLLGVFAALATLLSCVGIYGVISYVAEQRTYEIGVRIALGAEPGSVLRMMLSQAGRLALVGIPIGLVAAAALTRLMSGMLFGVSAHDPLTYLGVTLLFLLVAMAACLVPARRAMRVDPVIALRYDG